MTGLLADDTAWFVAHPHREFRCRHLSDAERASDDEAHVPAPAVRLIYIRRSDGASVKVWTPNPGLLLGEDDDGRARFAARGMSNPPAFDEPITHVETIPVSPETAAYLDGVVAEISNKGRC